MSSFVMKSFRNIAAVAFLVSGCGGAEPIPVDVTQASEPCEYAREFMKEGMIMVVQDGRLTVAPKDDVQAAYLGWGSKGPTTQALCEGCH